MGKKLRIVYVTYVKVNVLLENLTIHFYRLKLAAERADPHEADARVTNLLPLVVHATSLFRERTPKKYF